MKKFYAFAAAAMMAFAANAQDGAPLYATGAGEFEGGEWSPAAASEFVYAGGQYTLEVANLSQFKISTVLGDWPEFNGGALTCQYGEEPGVAVALEVGDGNIVTPWKGDYTITVAGDLSTITLTTETPAPTGPTLIYLRGDMNSWNPVAEWAMTQVTDNLYKYEFGEGLSIGLGQAFKIADADWNAYNIGGGGEAILLETDTQVFNGGNPANMTLDEECNGVVWLVLDYEGSGENYVWFSNDKEAYPEWAEVSGVKIIGSDVAAPARYFNLQGVEVANPSNGIYIVVKGDKVSKAVVK